MTVANVHTYFVGSEEAALWVHNCVIENAAGGKVREAKTQADLEAEHPHASVQREQYLRTADGKIAKDPATETGRRLDHVVIENGKSVKTVETTSHTASKADQQAKEANIRRNGGTYIRDRNTRELVDTGEDLAEERRHD